MTLATACLGRNNNLDAMRAAAAAVVMFAHSLTVSGDKLGGFLGTLNRLELGDAAVAVFFVVSGFLVARSWETSTPWRYALARFLRIFPALAVVVVVSVFLLGPLATSLPIREYFNSQKTWAYLQTLTLVPFDWRSLPGVFTGHSASTTNGSLWTIPYEAGCYLLVALWGMSKAPRLALPAAAGVLLLASVFGQYETFFLGLRVSQIERLGAEFLLGVCAYAWREKITLNSGIALVSALVLGGLLGIGGLWGRLAMVPGAYLVMYLAYHPPLVRFAGFARYGDYSYGMYLYAFPVQQWVTHIYGGRMDALLNFVLSFPVTLLLAYISWHLVEKRALALKHKSLHLQTINHLNGGLKMLLMQKMRKKKLNMLNNEHGFSLTELAIALVVIAFFTAVVYLAARPYMEKSKIVSITEQLSSIKGAVASYYQDTKGNAPKSFAQLAQYLPNPPDPDIWTLTCTNGGPMVVWAVGKSDYYTLLDEFSKTCESVMRDDGPGRAGCVLVPTFAVCP